MKDPNASTDAVLFVGALILAPLAVGYALAALLSGALDWSILP